MIKNWKGLFVKDENEGDNPVKPKLDNKDFSFPVNQNFTGATAPSTLSVTLSEEAKEVMEIYEKGLDSINMPGYDFYEFYKAIQTAGYNSQPAYNMAYQMAKAMDSSLTTQKLVSDADFYISKINEVHSQYVMQGQQKLDQLSSQRQAEKTDLAKSIDEKIMRLAQLRAEVAEIETDLQSKRNVLAKIEDVYRPREQAIRSKLNANDVAKSNSSSTLTLVKDNIQKYISQ